MSYGESITSAEVSGRTGLDLLARVIYAEAEGETEMGKRGVACVVRNRMQHAKAKSEFGGTTYKDVILKSGAFSSVSSSRFLAPDTNSKAWADSLNIALNMDAVVNPISACLWFNGTSYYNAHSRNVNGQEQYAFGSGAYQDVIEKKVLGGHVFFRVRGY